MWTDKPRDPSCVNACLRRSDALSWQSGLRAASTLTRRMRGISLMSDHKRLGSLLIDRKISTKVVLGFVCVLAILGTVSGMAYFAFRSSAEGFVLYAQRVAVVGIARDIDRSFLNLRRFVREYAFTNVGSNIESAKTEEVILRGLLQKGLAEIKNPERHRRLEDISSVVDAYLKTSVRS